MDAAKRSSEWKQETEQRKHERWMGSEKEAVEHEGRRAWQEEKQDTNQARSTHTHTSWCTHALFHVLHLDNEFKQSSTSCAFLSCSNHSG